MAPGLLADTSCTSKPSRIEGTYFPFLLPKVIGVILIEPRDMGLPAIPSTPSGAQVSPEKHTLDCTWGTTNMIHTQGEPQLRVVLTPALPGYEGGVLRIPGTRPVPTKWDPPSSAYKVTPNLAGTNWRGWGRGWVPPSRPLGPYAG